MGQQTVFVVHTAGVAVPEFIGVCLTLAAVSKQINQPLSEVMERYSHRTEYKYYFDVEFFRVTITKLLT